MQTSASLAEGDRAAPPEPAPRRERVRSRPLGGTATRLVLWLILAPFAAWLVVRLLGLDGAWPAAQLLAFTPFVAAGAPLPVLLAALARRWRLVGLAAVVALTLAGLVLPRGLADRDALAGARGPALRILTVNMLGGNANSRAIAALVRAHRVDLLAVQELTAEAAARLRAAGLGELLPHRVLDPAEGTEGSGLYARFPLRDEGALVNRCHSQTMATLRVPGAAEVSVASVHACAPSPARATGRWRRSLAELPAADPTGRVRVLAGDFNATLDHAPLRELVGSGYRDAGEVAGAGLVGTWGSYRRAGPATVVIDHVLADRRVGVRAVSVHAVPRTDHRAVLAELVLP